MSNLGRKNIGLAKYIIFGAITFLTQREGVHKFIYTVRIILIVFVTNEIHLRTQKKMLGY